MAGFVGYFGAVLFGIGAIREEAQCCLVHPGSDVVRRPDLSIINDGPVECRLLCLTTKVDPCSDASRWRLVLNAATDLGIVEALQDDFQGWWRQGNGHQKSTTVLR